MTTNCITSDLCLVDPKCSANDLCKQCKDSLIEGMKQYIPQKPISSKSILRCVKQAIINLLQARNKGTTIQPPGGARVFVSDK